MTITSEEIKKLQELEARADAGIWITSDLAHNRNLCNIVVDMPEAFELVDLHQRSNADFIAAIRNAAPSLLKEVLELRGKLEQAKALIDKVRIHGAGYDEDDNKISRLAAEFLDQFNEGEGV